MDRNVRSQAAERCCIKQLNEGCCGIIFRLGRSGNLVQNCACRGRPAMPRAPPWTTWKGWTREKARMDQSASRGVAGGVDHCRSELRARRRKRKKKKTAVRERAPPGEYGLRTRSGGFKTLSPPKIPSAGEISAEWTRNGRGWANGAMQRKRAAAVTLSKWSERGACVQKQLQMMAALRLEGGTRRHGGVARRNRLLDRLTWRDTEKRKERPVGPAPAVGRTECGCYPPSAGPMDYPLIRRKWWFNLVVKASGLSVLGGFSGGVHGWLHDSYRARQRGEADKDGQLSPMRTRRAWIIPISHQRFPDGQTLAKEWETGRKWHRINRLASKNAKTFGGSRVSGLDCISLSLSVYPEKEEMEMKMKTKVKMKVKMRM
ncbi:hypothetical protein B0J11DRAFT_590001 [Dendryphion nanum]|uniref:Uncharacterized protein n=1 Tax=Dendryphion nanum TaxID=256645 RepID=A0A9P9DKG0_9PLEO|nr:hypothetical protein B0J11DRAFT_590001 [Dendryphion nanum]